MYGGLGKISEVVSDYFHIADTGITSCVNKTVQLEVIVCYITESVVTQADLGANEAGCEQRCYERESAIAVLNDVIAERQLLNGVRKLHNAS